MGFMQEIFGGPILDNVNLPNYAENRKRLGTYLGQGQGPYVGANPYRQGWDSLISQLQSGPSLAEAQYRRAAQEGNAAIMGLARANNRPGSFRAALIQQAKANQGLAAGSAEAALQEQTQNRQLLGSALTNAGQAQWQRDAANQQAWQQLLQQQMGLDMDQAQMMLQKEQIRANSPTAFQQLAGIGGQALQFAGSRGTGQQAAGPTPRLGTAPPGMTLPLPI